jgi:pimeloyl-ACP methyl ester carboxylesterase
MEVLHSKIIGTGVPLLVLHGYFGMGDNWKSIANQLASDYQVHLIDQRNHGRSFHSEDFDYDLMVEDLKNYTLAHNLSSAHVLGHSMGGKTAMLYAVAHPDRVQKLMVADIAPRAYKPHHESILSALNAVDFEKIQMRSDVDTLLKKQLPEEGVRQFLLKNVYRKSKDELAFRFNLESLTRHHTEIGVALPPYTEFNGPVLFLKGALSDYISREDLALINAHFPAAKLVTLSGAGHWLHAENPTDFLKSVRDFLGESSPKKPQTEAVK